ncbi:MAG: sulfite exporter TauE/SafE family protein [Anaerolineae bacterium]
MTTAQTLLTLLITVVASLVTGVTGFGFGLVATPLYANLMPLSEAVLIVTITSLPLMVQNTLTVKRAVPWKDIWPLLLTSLPASAVGTILLAHSNTVILRYVLAATTLLGCLVAVWVPKRALIHKAFPWAFIAGLVGGFIGGAVAAGGPPVVLYCLLRGWDKHRMKVILSVYFTVSTTWRLLQMIVNGLTPWPVVRLAIILIIPAALVCYLGNLIFRRISTSVFRYSTIALLVAMAVNLVIK